MRSALITGGAGFIGSHLAERLLRDGWEVYVIDNLSTGSVKNLDAVRDHEHFHLTLDSIENEAALMELVDRADVVYHLAAAVGVKLIVEDPVRTIETNIHGTELILQHCEKKGKKVLLASTSEVYGKGSRDTFSEGDDLVFGATTRARWAYGCSKAIDEFLALAYCRSRNLPAVIMRFFNTVGPRQTGQYGMVIPRFVQQALAGDPITVYGDGEQVRCFAHVADVVRGIVALMSESKAEGRIFNIGSSDGITINQLAEKVKAITGSDSEIVRIPYEQAYEAGFEDMRIRVPDTARVRELVGFEITRDIDQIIRDVAEYFRHQSSASSEQ